MANDSALPIDVDIGNCDREPIHMLGGVQSFGFLIALTADWMVARVSTNTIEHLGLAPDKLLGRPAHLVLSGEALHLIRNRLSMLRGPDAMERIFMLTLVAGRPPFDVAVHFSGDVVILEAEPSGSEPFDAITAVRAMTMRLAHAKEMAAFFREGARQLRALIGFDRVMIYRFDADGSGEVVAESVASGIDSFLGLHYPASDIPAQARALYVRNIFRIIADVNAPPVAIRPQLDLAGQPLDQSLCVMRAVSPIHIEYLRNMGVSASLSISIVCDGKLWGLFACHHHKPRLPAFAQRSAAELFGQMFSMTLEGRERQQTAEFESRARGAADRLMASIARDADLLGDPQWIGEIVFEAIPADGIGVYLGGRTSLSGLTPPPTEFETIIESLNQAAAGAVFATDTIQTLTPRAALFADRAAGLLAIPLSRSPRDYVVLFRSEQLRSIRWGGNPEKALELGPNGARLTPRKSFEEWSELVRGRARPFSPAERRVAETIRVALLEVVLRMSENATIDRRIASEKQDLLIAELNHRVRNILALIRGLISQSRKSSLTSEAFAGTLDDRIQALARAHDQLTADRWSPARLSELIEVEASAYLGLKRDRVRLAGPNVLIEPSAFTTLALVIHELMTNAAKYGALSDSGVIDVTWLLDPDGNLRIVWIESGGPAVTAPPRRGFGSSIIERSIPFDLGGTADIRFRLSGVEASFSVPARFVAGKLPSPVEHTPSASLQRLDPGLLNGRRVLLVEDSMIIALDAEDALRSLGADIVTTAATIARAMEILDTQTIDFAVLDFNLGTETSLGVADRLAAAGIPFSFATGYGSQIDLPERLRATPVIKKPYHTRGPDRDVVRPASQAGRLMSDTPMPDAPMPDAPPPGDPTPARPRGGAGEPSPPEAGGLLAVNIMHFARLLRRAGLPLGPADLLAAAEAVTRIDLGSRREVRTALQATMVHRHEHEDLFDAAFRMFWRDPDAGRHAALADLLEGQEMQQQKAPPGSRRLAEATKPQAPPKEPDAEQQTIDARLTVSAHERLQTMDFEAMGADEITQAKAEIRRLALPLDELRTRRLRPDPSGNRIDLRATIRGSLRCGGEIMDVARSRRVTRPPPLVVLCDISGSMGRYAQILLHFLHAVANDRDRVSTFLFGTRLSNITRQLRHRDPEIAFQMVSHAVPDWSGGTRIGDVLETFNRTWARRVLTQGAVVLLVTDGLDREGAHGVSENMDRLHKSCRRLIWLNPLLRWNGFEPRSQGVRAMLPHVDEFRPVHNLASLRDLVTSLSRPSSPRAMDKWRLAS